MASRRTLCCAFAALLAGTPALAADDDELALAYGDAATVSIATGNKQSLRRAPAVATVFTAEDIRASGATDLTELLQRVPGLHVSRTYYINEPRFQLRGVQSEFSQQVLILIDGVRRQSILLGSPEELWVSMPLDQVARVEVIRGPGSALYGADALAGVIAITTWRAGEQPGTQLGLQAGAFDTRAASLRHSGRSGDWSWLAWLRAGRSDGQAETLRADAQTGLDAAFGTQASRAPGPMSTRHRDLDLQLRLGWQEWQAQASLKRRRGIGSGPGLAQALSDRDWADTDFAVLALDWQHSGWLPDWDAQLHASITHTQIDSLYQLFPPGAFGGLYPEGMLGGPGRNSRVHDLEGSLLYGGWAQHRLRLLAGWRRSDLYATREVKNFNFQVLPGVGSFPVPLGSLVDVSASGPYVTPQQRDLHFLALQDEWQLAQDWTLTAGLRHDRYSDFGHTTNPRLALVWDARHDLTLKALHGRAFRAPSFAELHNINNPVNLGNPDARPEHMATTELTADWQAHRSLQLRLNLFRYRMHDILRLVPHADPSSGATTQNLGTQDGHGFEAEARWQPGPAWRVDASWSQQISRDRLTGLRSADAPRRMAKLALEARLNGDWAASLQARHIAGRARAAGDARPALADYTLADLGLHWRRSALQGWQASLLLNNLADADAREPSPAPGSIPYDLPLPRRYALLELGYRF